MSFGEFNFDEDSEEQGSKFKKKVVVAIKPNSHTVFRVIPPLFSLEGTKKYGVMHKIHWGYKGLSKKDPTKLAFRPFECVEVFDWKTKTILLHCPMCDEIQKKKEQKQLKEAELLQQGKSQDEVREKLAPLNEWLRTFNLDKKYHVNVKTPEGVFGKIKLSSTNFSKLRSKTEELWEKKKINAISNSGGVWIDIQRFGNGFGKEDELTFVTEQKLLDDGDVVDVLKKAPLTEEDYQKALTDCWELADSGAFKLTLEQVKMLVESSGDPEDVDRVFNLTQKVESKKEKDLDKLYDSSSDDGPTPDEFRKMMQ